MNLNEPLIEASIASRGQQESRRHEEHEDTKSDLSRRDLAGARLQRHLLHAPRSDLGDVQLVLVAAIHRMCRREFTWRFARLAESSEHLAVQLHLVDLARYAAHVRGARVRVRVRAVKILMRTRGDADRPWRTNVVVDGAQRQVVAEHLD